MLEDDDPGTPYIDPVQMAAVLIRHAPDGTLQMDGVIGDDLLIKPASSDINFLSDYFDLNKDFMAENGNRIATFGKDGSNVFENSSSGVHLVYRSLMKSKASHKALNDVLNSIDPADGKSYHKGPLHVWPEVLLMVDYDTYAMHAYHGFDDSQMRRYYVSFLNGVDLRFKTLSNPKISLILSHIVIFKSRDATLFLKENLYPDTNIFNGDKAMSDLARYLYSAKEKEGVYPEFDVALLLTNLDMCAEEIVRCNPETVGLAYFMGACNTVHAEERWLGVAIVEDKGGFDGVLTAAHEIGHLLGADHDGVPHFRSDTSGCSHKDGYIMSHVLASKRIFQWSECSINQFRFFLSSKRASCLFNEPSQASDLEGIQLPGAMLSLDEQCERIWGVRACAWDSQVCVSLRCFASGGDGAEYCAEGPSPAAEGSSCGKDLHCRHGRCVSNSLVYSQAWNMATVYDDLKYRNHLKITTTKKPPTDEACTENKDEFFCESFFWTIGHKEACRNSRIIEECCYSYKVFCKVKSLLMLI